MDFTTVKGGSSFEEAADVRISVSSAFLCEELGSFFAVSFPRPKINRRGLQEAAENVEIATGQSANAGVGMWANYM